MVVTESAKVTQSRGSKKVEAYHLCALRSIIRSAVPLTSRAFLGGRKHAIETTDMLDFLKDLVENIPDPSAGGTVSLNGEDGGKPKRGRKKAVVPTDSDGEAAPKPKKPRKKRVKKEQVQEEDDHDMAEQSRSAPEENWDDDDDE